MDEMRGAEAENEEHTLGYVTKFEAEGNEVDRHFIKRGEQ